MLAMSMTGLGFLDILVTTLATPTAEGSKVVTRLPYDDNNPLLVYLRDHYDETSRLNLKGSLAYLDDAVRIVQASAARIGLGVADPATVGAAVTAVSYSMAYDAAPTDLTPEQTNGWVMITGFPTIAAKVAAALQAIQGHGPATAPPPPPPPPPPAGSRKTLGPLMSKEAAACIRSRQAELGRALTVDEVRVCLAGGGGGRSASMISALTPGQKTGLWVIGLGVVAVGGWWFWSGRRRAA